MKAEELVGALVKAGAVLSLQAPGRTFILAAVAWQGNPTRLKWCAVYPEDQHHIHTFEYAEAVVIHARDVAFYDGVGEMVAYICPIEESALDADAARAMFSGWLHELGTHQNQLNFDRFFTEN